MKDINEQMPIRVVVFSSGPMLEHGVKEFLCRLEKAPEIALLGIFCQSKGNGFAEVVRDLWRRRRFLAAPLLLTLLIETMMRYGSSPTDEMRLNREIKRLQDRIHFMPDIHAAPVLEAVTVLAPDLGLIYGSPILKPILFEIPHCGTLGIHHGKLPHYRGKKTTFWAVYNGEETAGVTIQKVNAGLDTGEIVQAGEVSIGKRGHRAVWQELEQLGLDLYLRAVLEVKAGTAIFTPFPGKKGKLYRDPKLTDLVRYYLRRRMR